MKKFIIFNIIFLNAFILFSQQDEQISLVYFDHMAINAGFAGNKNAICANAIVRNQWLGFGQNGTAAISTQIFNINAPIKLFGIKHGLGLVIKNDLITPASNTNLNLAYAYNTEVGQGNLGIGIDFGFWNRKLDGSLFNSVEFESSIPTQEVSDMFFDMGLGAFYKTDNLFLGVSGKHLNFGTADYGQSYLGEKIVSHFYISGGYTYQLTNPLFEVQPSVHFKSGGLKSQVSYNARVLYNKKLWGGVSYNHADAIVIMFGMEIPSGLKFAVAYDVPLTKVATAGTVEIMIGYCFNLSVEKTTPSYKSVRFL